MTKIFSGTFKTTDGREWSVAFKALNWEDAESIAESFNIGQLGLSLGVTDIEPIDGILPNNLEETTPHFAAWEFKYGKFYNPEA